MHSRLPALFPLVATKLVRRDEIVDPPAPQPLPSSPIPVCRRSARCPARLATVCPYMPFRCLETWRFAFLDDRPATGIKCGISSFALHVVYYAGHSSGDRPYPSTALAIFHWKRERLPGRKSGQTHAIFSHRYPSAHGQATLRRFGIWAYSLFVFAAVYTLQLAFRPGLARALVSTSGPRSTLHPDSGGRVVHTVCKTQTLPGGGCPPDCLSDSGGTRGPPGALFQIWRPLRDNVLICQRIFPLGIVGPSEVKIHRKPRKLDIKKKEREGGSNARAPIGMEIAAFFFLFSTFPREAPRDPLPRVVRTKQPTDATERCPGNKRVVKNRRQTTR